MLGEVDGRRKVAHRSHSVEAHPLAGCLHEAAQRLERRLPMSVLVGRYDGLGGTRACRELTLSESRAPPRRPDERRRIHGNEHISNPI